MRNPICTFGVSAFGRPPLFFAASIMPGSTSAIGFTLNRSDLVNSRTSPDSWVSGRLFIGSLPSFVCLAETDDPADVAPDEIADDVEPPLHRRQGNDPFLAVVAPVIDKGMGFMLFQFGGKFERQAALPGVFFAFLRIELNFHRCYCSNKNLADKGFL